MRYKKRSKIMAFWFNDRRFPLFPIPISVAELVGTATLFSGVIELIKLTVS